MSKILLRTNICKAKNSYYISKKVIRANNYEIHVTLVVKINYKIHIIPIVKSSLIQYNSEIQLTLVIVKYSEVILLKFKIMKFII